jgi:hypothetical protein
MIADVVLEQEITHEEARDRKEWLTSSEAREYVIEYCPNIYSSWGYTSKYSRYNPSKEKGYRRLYDMVEKHNTLRGKVAYDYGNRRTRFYLKEDLDDIENSVYREEGETEESLTVKHGALSEISEMYKKELELLEEKYRAAENERCRIYDKREFLRQGEEYTQSYEWYNDGGYQRKQ